LSRDGWATCRK